ncbi:4-hydroxybenzoate 3-monooxygenase [Conexibacter woesei]|uniref:4-hydroxybenzoate 3-monooxygenase n=1 Tax=Conexibacter woesei TaxID=191495 RepID=UPI00041C22C8|nr:4-hydroxybenzoate 3-monooxygenase [Conexibacter woesei]
MRTQVGIVGAGPAGLVLAHLLHLQGIESVVLEARDREYVQQRVRAGVLEQNTVDLLREAGVAERLDREGIVHHGIELRFDGEGHRIAMSDLTGGRAIWIYGQQEVVKDLIAAREAAGDPPVFEVSDVQVHDVDGDAPFITYRTVDGEDARLDCDVIAGCDGFHGICRPAVGADRLQIAEREYPFGWLGILADVAPSTDELIYAYHDRGFAMHSLRSPTLSRLYLQVDPDDDIANWPDDRIWEELHLRFEAPGWSLTEGPIIEKGITPMRSFVAAPMRRGKLFLAGDAAHIVPPTGAKGLNLAVNDVRVLAEALTAFYANGSTTGLDEYSDTCLQRVWRVQDFSTYMTTLLHRLDGDDFDAGLQRARLRYVTTSEAAARSLAENYVGLPT